MDAQALSELSTCVAGGAWGMENPTLMLDTDTNTLLAIQAALPVALLF